MDPEDHTFKCAAFLAHLNYEDLPEDVIEQAKKSILNSLGCGLGSAQASPSQKVLSTILEKHAAPKEAIIIGRRQRTSVENATLLNGVALTCADYDDTHLRTVIHPSGTPLAALLSWGEKNHMSGKDLILAFVCGVEAQCAVGNAISPSHYRDGW